LLASCYVRNQTRRITSLVYHTVVDLSVSVRFYWLQWSFAHNMCLKAYREQNTP